MRANRQTLIVASMQVVDMHRTPETLIIVFERFTMHITWFTTLTAFSTINDAF